MKKITLIYTDDWMGLYIDDNLVYEGHEIEEEVLLKHLNIDCDALWADEEWLNNRGNLPKKLEDVQYEQP